MYMYIPAYIYIYIYTYIYIYIHIAPYLLHHAADWGAQWYPGPTLRVRETVVYRVCVTCHKLRDMLWCKCVTK